MLLGCALMACEGDSPEGDISVRLGFVAPGTTRFTATLDGRTYREPGVQLIRLKADTTYEITGSFTGQGLAIVFSGSFSGAGGVRFGSLISIEGPAAFENSCDVSYLPPDTGSYNFRLRFQTTSTREEGCYLLL